MIAWEWVGGPGLEVLALSDVPDGVRAEGVVVALLNGATFRLRYKLACDARWQFLNAEIAIEQGSAQQILHLAHDPSGGWTANGASRPDLAGCIDIDIMATPFTNTLPIRRLAWPDETARRIRVAYIRVPDLHVAAAEQEYTRLAPGRFRYHGLGTDFTAELSVDQDGVVIDYGTIWRRLCQA